MRRTGWLALSVVLAFSLPAVAADAPTFGTGPAYEQLGHLAVLHQGRVKPLDTMARQLVKQFYGAETITLFGPDGKPTARWGHVGALLDMTVRPEFWDDQETIRVDYMPLRQMILAAPAQKALLEIAAKPSTSASDRSRLEKAAAGATVAPDQVTELLRATNLPQTDRKTLDRLAARLHGGGANRWISPHELENAKVAIEGRKVAFEMWLADIASLMEGGSMAQHAKVPELEKRAYEAGIALRHYQAIRGDRALGEPLDLVEPRPNNVAYLKYSAQVREKLAKSAHAGGDLNMGQLSPIEQDSWMALAKYLSDLQRDEWRVPGTDAKFDARFTAWLREKSPWVPLRVLLDADPNELAQAGYPASDVQAFRAAHQAVADAEIASPGKLPEAKAVALVNAARRLGESTGQYPTSAALARETHFNAFAPFYKATLGYGLGLVLLLLSMGIRKEPSTWTGNLGLGLRYGGLAAFITGIALEIYGFYYRIRISGWAPVTNMYETVIWVALVVAVIGFVLELIYRRTYTALAASGVAFLCTLLAYKVTLLDPNIKSLTPVLRSNYWLTIHVLTEVSSYAAFALAMGLGLIATAMYLVATYRRSVPYRELAMPLGPGLSLLAVGTAGVWASYEKMGPALLQSDWVFYPLAALGALGGMLIIVALGAVVGELVSRVKFRENYVELNEELAGENAAAAAARAAGIEALGAGGSVATLARPTIAEIRARAAAARPKLDARGLAMQATAAQLKPLSNYIYRAIQVGVLLIAAGTILGGLWADVSWGRFWGWDPKEVWALITLLLYLAPLHGRFAGWVNTFGLVACSVVCFMSVVMAWYGVNFVLGVGLHSYGFVEGGGQGIVFSVCLAVLALVGAAGWRRHLGQMQPA